MRAMVFDGTSPVLRETQVADPVAGAGKLLIDVHACGVCRTDLHVVDRDLTEPKIPLIPGHEIVGVVAQVLPMLQAVAAMAARVSEPWHTHPIPGLEVVHTLAYRRDHTHYLVPGNQRDLRFGQIAIDNVQIGAAHATCVNIDQQLAGTGDRFGNLRLPQHG
jgi:hypothetical protein